MKKLKRISLEDFDKLSSAEASRLVGGSNDGTSIGDTIPPPYKPVTFKYDPGPTYNGPIFYPTYNPIGVGGKIYF